VKVQSLKFKVQSEVESGKWKANAADLRRASQPSTALSTCNFELPFELQTLNLTLTFEL
jgi:hypothetical protein